ncbi:MAG TPA: TrkA family potassium uptake protein [Candidatus Hydrogenedentes bacterium]|nr:TrkA family potassium uptake protein [Candidatus Hydrogenedentota bacterium]
MKQFAVIGLGNFGYALAQELMEQGAQVIAVDRDADRIEAVKDMVTYAVTLEAGNEAALKSISIQEVDAAIVCIGANVEANLLITVLLKRVGVPKIWARAISPLQQEILKALNVDSILNLEYEMGRMVARSLVVENVLKHVYLSPGYSVAEVKVPEALVGKTLRQSGLRKDFNLNVVGIKKKVPEITKDGERTFEEKTENVPSPDTRLEEEDILMLVGKDTDVARFTKA